MSDETKISAEPTLRPQQTADNEDKNGKEDAKGTPKPHKSQFCYWKTDIILKIVTICVAIYGFRYVGGQLDIANKTLENNTLNLRNNTQQSMDRITLDLDKVFIDHPELYAYVWGTNTISEGDTNFERAKAAAIMTLDVFDAAARQSDQYHDLWKHSEAWDVWIKDSLTKSPFLREQLRKSSGWYPGLTNYLNDVDSDLAQKKTATP